MTAIAIGSLLKANILVIDAMVQTTDKPKEPKDYKMDNKLVEMETSGQFLALCGEGLIADGAKMINDWCKMRKIKIDLFNSSHFTQILRSAERYRKFFVEIAQGKIIPQDSTIVYVLSRTRIKIYEVKYLNFLFFIDKEYDFKDNKFEINYCGNIRDVSLPADEIDPIKYGKEQIINAHNSKPILKHDFDNRFSSVYLPKQIAEPVEVMDPYIEFTEIYLKYGNIWDYVNEPDFKWSPKF